MPVPDRFRDCGSRLPNLFEIALNRILDQFAVNKLFLGDTGRIALNLLNRCEDLG